MQKKRDYFKLKAHCGRQTAGKTDSFFQLKKNRDDPRSVFQAVNRIRQCENGNVVILVAVSMVVIMIILALVIDLGLAYLSTNQQQKVADAAVYSAGRLLPIDTGDTTAINEIKDSAIHYASLNEFDALQSGDVTLGNVKNGQYTDIKVTVSKTVVMNFARVFGVDSLNISRSAVAKLSPVIRTTGVAPIGGSGCTADHYEPSCLRIVKVPIYSYGIDKKTIVVEGFAAFLLESQTNDGYITGTFLNMVSDGSPSGANVGEGSEADFGLYNLLLSE